MQIQRAACIGGLLLSSACASDSTSYSLGDSQVRLPRAEAERAHGSRPTSTANHELDSPLKIIVSPLPEYPPGLRNDDVVGPVRLRFYVEADGTVSNASVVGSPPAALAAISLDAIVRWRFEPPTRAGKPVRVPLEQEFRFALE